MTDTTPTLYARVSKDFNGLDANQVIVAVEGEDLRYTQSFTEEGYDTADYQAPPRVIEVTPSASRYADENNVDAAAEQAGVKLYLTREEYERWHPNRDVFDSQMREENTEPNELLQKAEVTAVLDSLGFDAFHGSITIENTQPVVRVFWRNNFSFADAPVKSSDPDHPHDIQIDDSATTPKL